MQPQYTIDDICSNLDFYAKKYPTFNYNEREYFPSFCMKNYRNGLITYLLDILSNLNPLDGYYLASVAGFVKFFDFTNQEMRKELNECINKFNKICDNLNKFVLQMEERFIETLSTIIERLYYSEFSYHYLLNFAPKICNIKHLQFKNHVHSNLDKFYLIVGEKLPATNDEK